MPPALSPQRLHAWLSPGIFSLPSAVSARQLNKTRVGCFTVEMALRGKDGSAVRRLCCYGWKDFLVTVCVVMLSFEDQ